MKLLKLTINDGFRSLHEGFSIDFHKSLDSMETFQPFCFAGLNGSGKSNVLEALASIFYHLEFCVSKFRPQSFDLHFKRDVCSPNAYKLEYLIGGESSSYNLSQGYKVTIIKKNDQKKREENEPKLYIQKYPYTDDIEKHEVSLNPSVHNEEAAAAKRYLPDLVVAYSSGENETLSLPFIKNRLINFDKYFEDYKKGLLFDEPESSLVYIDEEMSQAVLLAALLFEDEKTLKPLKKELGILELQSFTIHLNNQRISQEVDVTEKPLLFHVEDTLNQLKKCATSWFTAGEDVLGEGGNIHSVTSIDFFVDEATKSAFKEYFSTSFELFRFFQVLYELNSNIVSESIKDEVYSSKGFYTKGKLPVAAPVDRVFHFLDFKILKKIKGKKEPKALLLREFSDGEQQFLHTIGICLMLKDRRTLLLLDEPETHFNPAWRAKFIKILNDSIYAGRLKNLPNGDFNVHLLKDVVLTSHSPFIISDCLPNNVIFFKRNLKTDKVEAKSAKEMNIRTFGTSVEYILDELFDYNQSIGDWANEKLKQVKFDKIKDQDEVAQIKEELRVLGDSIEKDLVLAKLNRLFKKDA
jgi:restriction system-associated AAA family ATPase